MGWGIAGPYSVTVFCLNTRWLIASQKHCGLGMWNFTAFLWARVKSSVFLQSRFPLWCRHAETLNRILFVFTVNLVNLPYMSSWTHPSFQCNVECATPVPQATETSHLALRTEEWVQKDNWRYLFLCLIGKYARWFALKDQTTLNIITQTGCLSTCNSCVRPRVSTQQLRPHSRTSEHLCPCDCCWYMRSPAVGTLDCPQYYWPSWEPPCLYNVITQRVQKQQCSVWCTYTPCK